MEKARDVAYLNYRHRKLSYMLGDEEIVQVSASTVYRVLKKHGLIKEWAPTKKPMKKKDVPTTGPNQVWHTDICYIPVRDFHLCLTGSEAMRSVILSYTQAAIGG